MSNNTILATAPLTTQNYVLKATGTALGNSLIWDNGTNVGIGNTNTSYTLDVSGTGRYTTSLLVNNISILSSTMQASGNYYIGCNNANFIQFYTSNTDRMAITAAGNVGIGTTSPSDILDVQKNQNGITNFYFRNTDTTNSSSRAYINLISGTVSLLIKAIHGDHTYLTPSSGSDLYLGYNNSTRITSGGLVLVGGASHTDGSMFQSPSANTTLNAYRQTTGDSGIMGFYSNQTSTKNVVAYIRCDGGLANYSANNLNLSDERTKNSIIPIESYWDKFKAIQIVKFKYNGQVHDDYNIGVIAQQVETIAPEFVSNEGWGLDENNKQDLKSIYESDLHHATIKVLQEAMTKIEEQQIQIQNLQEQINILAK